MIQQADIIDRKIIALAGTYKNAVTKLIDEKIDGKYFKAEYQALVGYMLDYYKLHHELITQDALMEILVTEFPNDVMSATTIATAFSDIVLKETDEGDIENKDDITELEFFLERLKNRRVLSILTDASVKLARTSQQAQIDKAREILVNTLTTIDSVRTNANIQEGNISDFVEERIADYDDRKNNPNRFQGVYSGFPVLDKETDGFQKGELIIYVAAPGGGKSASLLHSGFHAWKQRNPATDRGANVVLFTLEMFRKAYMRRFDAMHASLDTNKLKTASLDNNEYTAWRNALEYQRSKNNFFYIVDIPSNCTTLFIKNKLDEIRLKHPDNPIDLVIADYMGIMETPKNADGDWLRQGYISQECKELARSEQLPFLTAIQETRDSIKDKKKSKDTAALSRSQMIPANADIIIFVEKEVAESNSGDYEVFKRVNEYPTSLIYQTIKHRDGKQVKWRAGVDFGRMLIQPMAHAEGEEPKDPLKEEPKKIAPTLHHIPQKKELPKTPKKNNEVESSDDEEFDLYYDNLFGN